VYLGEALKHAARFAQSASDEEVAVPSDEFVGADSIFIFRTDAGLVRRVLFRYESKDVADMVNGYRESLGAPVDSVSRANRASWTWRDSLTEFTITSPSGARRRGPVEAQLLDRSAAHVPD
jgi:hypothetical protein